MAENSILFRVKDIYFLLLLTIDTALSDLTYRIYFPLTYIGEVTCGGFELID